MAAQKGRATTCSYLFKGYQPCLVLRCIFSLAKDNGQYPFCVPSLAQLGCASCSYLFAALKGQQLFLSLARDTSYYLLLRKREGTQHALIFSQPVSLAQSFVVSLPLQKIMGAQKGRDTTSLRLLAQSLVVSFPLQKIRLRKDKSMLWPFPFCAFPLRGKRDTTFSLFLKGQEKKIKDAQGYNTGVKNA